MPPCLRCPAAIFATSTPALVTYFFKKGHSQKPASRPPVFRG